MVTRCCRLSAPVLLRSCLATLLAMVALPASRAADTCTTQSAMQPAQRAAIAAAASGFAQQVTRNDITGLKSQAIPVVAGNFSGVSATVNDAAGSLKSATFTPQTLWLLDSPAGDSGESASDAQFFCDLNKGTSSVTFLIPSLPHGRYALALLESASPAWSLGLLMQAGSAGQWLLAGLYLHPLTAAGHDGLWYWRQARDFAAKKESWNAWIYYGEAAQLLRPVPFLASTHMDALEDEWRRAAPPALSAGIRPDAPLVIRSREGTEYRITGLAADSSLPNPKVDVSMHFLAEPAADPPSARARNLQAARALLAAYPELRTAFHGVWIFAEASNGTNFASEEPMDKIAP